ncbi:MAG: ABC transporter permease [Clostridiales bacterium]|nr:ABC transporter permease [Clostridiales bacterium]
MKKLISLELKRNSLKPYYIAVGIIMISMLGFLYLIAAMPKIDPSEADLEIFSSYGSIIMINNIIGSAIFSILSAVMASKFIIEEYSGKKAILLFSYPISRTKILDAKILMIFSYTVLSMLVSGGIILLIFFTTESLFPLCSGTLTFGVILNSFISLFFYALIAGLLGVISLWFGFVKKSVAVTIVSSCIISSIISQISAMSLTFNYFTIIVLIIAFIAVIPILGNLHKQVKKMEV